MRVLYKDKRSGIERMISDRDAKILSALKRGTYITRDMAKLAPTKPMQADDEPEENEKKPKVKAKQGK